MSDDTTRALSVLRETVGEAKAMTSIGAITSNLVNLVRMAGFHYFPGTTRPLSLHEVLQISAVMVCLDILSQDIAKTTLRLYRRLPSGGKQVVMPGEHPAAELLATEPNRHHHWYELIEMMMLHMGLLQNAFWAKRTAPDGTVLELIPVLPARVRIGVDEETGIYFYEVKCETPHERVQLRGLPEYMIEGELIHFRGRMFDGLYGYSNMEAGAKTFRLADELSGFQTRLFENDASMRGIFQMGAEAGELSEDAFKRLRTQLGEAFGRMRREALPIVLENGLEFKGIAMNAEQAEVQKAWDSAIVNVARQFRLPPHKIFHLVNVKYENMETLERSYVADSLVPYCKRIELRLKKELLLTKKERAEFFFEFDREEMVLHDPKVQAEMLKVLLPHGVITLDEARQMRGRNPLPNGAGEARLIGSTYSLVGPDNEVIIPAGGQDGTGEEDPADEGADDDVDAMDDAEKAARLRLVKS